MSEQLLQLVTDIFFDVLKCVEKCRGNGRRSGAILDSGAQVLLAGVHQAAVRMIDDHEFLGTKQIVRNDQRTQSVVGDDPSGIADDVRVPLPQAQSANREAGVHAGEDGEFALRTWRQFPEFMRARVDLIGGENFVNLAHGGHSLT